MHLLYIHFYWLNIIHNGARIVIRSPCVKCSGNLKHIKTFRLSSTTSGLINLPGQKNSVKACAKKKRKRKKSLKLNDYQRRKLIIILSNKIIVHFFYTKGKQAHLLCHLTIKAKRKQ